MEGNRELDIVVFGATGFVGKLTAEYLAEHAPEGVRIGLAGRSQEKLDQVRSELGYDWPTIVADSSDPQSLKAMAEEMLRFMTVSRKSEAVVDRRRDGLRSVTACPVG